MQACTKQQLDTWGLITWLPRIPVTNSSFQSAVLFESLYEAGNSSEEDPRLDNLATSNSSYQLQLPASSTAWIRAIDNSQAIILTPIWTMESSIQLF